MFRAAIMSAIDSRLAFKAWGSGEAGMGGHSEAILVVERHIAKRDSNGRSHKKHMDRIVLGINGALLRPSTNADHR